MMSAIKFSWLCFFTLVVFWAAPTPSLGQDMGTKRKEVTAGQCLAVINKVLEMRNPEDSMAVRDAAKSKLNWEKMDSSKFFSETYYLAERLCHPLRDTYKSVLPCSEDEQKKEPFCKFYNACAIEAQNNFNYCNPRITQQEVMKYDPFINKRALVLKRESEQAAVQQKEKEKESKEKAELLARQTQELFLQTRERVTNAEIKGIGLNTNKTQFLSMKSNVRQIWKCEVLAPGMEDCFGSTFIQGACTPIVVNGITSQACRSAQISQGEMSAELKTVSTIAGNLLRDIEVKFIDGRAVRIQLTTTSQGNTNPNADEIVSLTEKFGPPLPIGAYGENAKSFRSTRSVSAWEGQDVQLTARRESSTGGAIIVLVRPSLLKMLEERRQAVIDKRNSEIQQERKRLSKDL